MMSRAELLALRVPRYTSYPTAPHFHTGVGASTYEDWLRQLPARLPLSLYVHVPFCDTLCWFCGCHTKVVNTYSPVASYLELLRSELALVSAIAGNGHPVTHIHFGGGSPTLLNPRDFSDLAAHIRSSFLVERNAEFAVEIDPRGLSDAMITSLAESGVNRVSIGVQDIDPLVQRAVNRIQPFETTRTAIEKLRAAGIANVNVDVMYGLPNQSVEHVNATIEAMLSLRPGRFAVFGYAHVPHMKRHMKLIDADTLPSTSDRIAQFDHAHRALVGAGYVPIGLDHFALPEDSMARAATSGTLSRNFQGYTTDAAPALLGIGASAIGSLPQGYVQNEPDVPRYRQLIKANKLPTARGVALTAEDKVRRQIIETLMCSLRVDLTAIASESGLAPNHFAAEIAALREFALAGFVVIDGWKLTVPANERSAVRLVAAVFDRYLEHSTARHALAV
jgi:oxygen-independent coproporphyrinogen-3 oxidase